MPKKTKTALDVVASPPKSRKSRSRRLSATFPPLEDGIVVTIQYPEGKMPEWSATHNRIVIATGSARGTNIVAPSPGGPFGGAPEASRTNITNTIGMGMTGGTMDPSAALRDGIPGLTAPLSQAVNRTLEAAEASAAAELDSIPDEEAEPEVVIPDA